MKKLIFLLIFISGYCYAQQPVFNFEANKAYKIQIQGISNAAEADNIARSAEKMQMSIFSFVDHLTGYGFFIVDNFYKVHEIEKLINNKGKYLCEGSEEIVLSEDKFLEIYMMRGGFKYPEFSINIPKEIVMGPYKELTYSLFSKAISIWKKAYSKTYNCISF